MNCLSTLAFDLRSSGNMENYECEQSNGWTFVKSPIMGDIQRKGKWNTRLHISFDLY